MTALCGLGLAQAGCARAVTVTDGHPDCVRNQHACIAMNVGIAHTNASASISARASACAVRAGQLRWAQGDTHGDLAALTRDSGRFDVVIAADCLFFRDFHPDLVWMLAHALAPGGVVLLLQPRRGRTLEQFVSHAQPLFSVEEVQEYCPRVAALHAGYADADPAYDADIHLPVLLRLRLRAAPPPAPSP